VTCVLVLAIAAAVEGKVVTQTFSDGRTDGRTDGQTGSRTMAAGASVTWTHCSVLFEITWNKTLASARTWASARTPLPPRPSPSLPSPSPSLPSPSPSLPPLPLSLPPLLVVVAGLEREKKKFNFQFSIFGFQSPKSPKSLSSPSSAGSAGFAGEAARRKRFFRPSPPSHPSKLYSSLRWLNSKIPKPFPPFSLRLIDVDGF
jgi:hypothetical protein